VIRYQLRSLTSNVNRANLRGYMEFMKKPKSFVNTGENWSAIAKIIMMNAEHSILSHHITMERTMVQVYKSPPRKSRLKSSSGGHVHQFHRHSEGIFNA